MCLLITYKITNNEENWEKKDYYSSYVYGETVKGGKLE